MLKQTQPTNITCASTAIANFLEVNVYEVIKDFHNKYLKHGTKISGYLSDYLNVEKCYTEDDIEHGYIYFLCVPSLFPEVPGATHVILGDNRGDSLEIVDSMEGRGPFYYRDENKFTTKSPHAFEFTGGFTPLCRVSAEDYAEYLEYKSSWETTRDENRNLTVGRFSADLMEDLRIHVANEEKRAYVRKQKEQEGMAVVPASISGTKVEVILSDSDDLSWAGAGLAGMFPGTKSGRG
ncbi:MAG: hypothetical protein [Bacteriophage sp.]|nr:MAG: hypothetical protein [Bacteriophage sp.]